MISLRLTPAEHRALQKLADVTGEPAAAVAYRVLQVALGVVNTITPDPPQPEKSSPARSSGPSNSRNEPDE